MSSHGVVPDGAEAEGVPNDVHGEFPSTALAEIAKETGETTQTPPKPGGLLRYVSRWNPRTTPRFTTTVLLYLLGLFLAFGAVPPVTISNEMQERYFGQMEFADSLDYAPRMAAERAYQKAQVATHRANGFLCWTNAKCKVKVNHLKHAEQTAKQHANVYREKRAKLVVAAKSELGLWSALGIGTYFPTQVPRLFAHTGSRLTLSFIYVRRSQGSFQKGVRLREGLRYAKQLLRYVFSDSQRAK